MTDRLSRRSLLGIAGGTIVTGLAGCLTGSDQSANNDGPEDTSENSTTDQESGDDGDTPSENETDGEGTESPSSAADVTMLTNDSGTHFDPHVVRIEPGEAVTWTLESGTHTTTAYAASNDKPQRIPDDAEAWDSGSMSEQGATFEHTFETEGVYDYYCRPHESTGMLGSVIVGDPDLEGQPGLAEPQSALPDATQTKIHELNEMVRGGGEGGHDHGHEDGH